MRLFEGVVLVATTLLAVYPLLTRGSFRRRRIGFGILTALGVALLGHAAIEGTRWTLVPCYVVILGLFVMHSRANTDKRWQLIATGALRAVCLFLLLISAFLSASLPVPVVLPDPTGPYAVGTFTLHAQQPDRPEPYADDPDAFREFPLQVWYPAIQPESGEPQAWVPDFDEVVGVVAGSMAERMGLPFDMRFALSQYRDLMGYAYPDARPPDDGAPFPVIVYSHGWTGFRTVALDQMENLASHGYVVAAPDHTYGAGFARFPDGRIVLNNPNAMGRGPERQAGIELLVDTFRGDVEHSIDMLGAMQSGAIDTRLVGKLDLDTLGIFGHSTGAGAVVETALLDDRIDAVIGLDIWFEPVSPELREQSLDVPLLSILSESWYGRYGNSTQLLFDFFEHQDAPVYSYYLADATHRAFTVAAVLSSFYRVARIQHTPGHRFLETNNDAIVRFFDATLRGQDPDAPALLADRHDLIRPAPKQDPEEAE